MIIKAQPDWGIVDLFISMKGSIVPIIYPKIIISGLFGIVAVVLNICGYSLGTMSFNFTPFTAFGVGLSIFLGFRNNACYDRWWEGRKLFGMQIIAVRNLGRILEVSLPKTDINMIYMRKIMHYASAHSHALRQQLRRSKDFTDRDKFLDETDLSLMKSSPNSAELVLILAVRTLSKINEENKLDSIVLMAIHEHINALCVVQAACERIASTTIPFPYTLLINRTVWIFVLLSAFALVDTCHNFTPIITAMLGYVFFGLHEVGVQIEDPFSMSPHALALNAICRVIDITTAVTLNDAPPPPYAADGIVLM